MSRTVATSDAAQLTPADKPPWEDSGVRTYTTRFHLRVLSESPLAQPSWGTVAKATHVRAGLNFGPQRVDDPEGEAWLAAQFPDGGTAVPPVDLRLDDSLRVEWRLCWERTCENVPFARSPFVKASPHSGPHS